jgi:hypothetical protein
MKRRTGWTSGTPAGFSGVDVARARRREGVHRARNPRSAPALALRETASGHSWRRASIGSSRAARRAGTKPNTTPINAENAKASALMPGMKA